jgi:hypothetical protein
VTCWTRFGGPMPNQPRAENLAREQADALESLRAGLLRTAAEQRTRRERRRWEAKAEGVALAMGHLEQVAAAPDGALPFDAQA